MHWLTSQFQNQRKESRYRRSDRTRLWFESRRSLILVALIFGMFGITDYNLLGASREYYLLLIMRLVVVGLCFLLAFILGRGGRYSRNTWLRALPLWILATGIILILPLRPDSLSSQLVALIVAILAFYLLIPNLLTVASLASLYLSIGFLVAAVQFAEIGPVTTLRIGLLLVMANTVGFFSLRRLETLHRKQFALLQAERDQNRHLLGEIAHRESLEAQLRMLAEQDSLTGLNNRNHFMKRARGLLQRAQIDQTPFSLFMIDVDHFKNINDTWGHVQGDDVLTRVAKVCAESIRPTHVIGRFGGEEFVVALPQTGPRDALILAERMRKNVADLRLAEPLQELRLSITIGIALASSQDRDLEPLIMRADQMLYRGKRNGKNQVVMESDESEQVPARERRE